MSASRSSSSSSSLSPSSFSTRNGGNLGVTNVDRDVYEVLEHRPCITTGSSDIDRMLGGFGIETGGITEIFGESGSGKTPLCHTLAVTVQIEMDYGGVGGKCLYIDTCGTFRPARIIPIAKRFGLDPVDVLDNIMYARAHNIDHQSDLVNQVVELFSESRFGLIIVDTACGLYRTDFCGRNDFSDRQRHLGRFLQRLKDVMRDFCPMAVVVTNDVGANKDGIGGGYRGLGDGGEEGCGGRRNVMRTFGRSILAHASTTRLWLRKESEYFGARRICNVYKSPSQPECEASFVIDYDGIRDEVFCLRSPIL